MKRKYLHRVQVYKRVNDDTFDGQHNAAPQDLGLSWCDVKTSTRDKLSSYGLDIATKAITILLRWRDDLDYEQEGIYFVYKGTNYVPKSITVIDREELYVEIFAIGER